MLFLYLWHTLDKNIQVCNKGQTWGMNEVELIGWKVSAPHWSQVYVATCIIGFTSVALVTMPLIEINFPIWPAFTSLIGSTLSEACVLKYTSNRLISSGGKVLAGGCCTPGATVA